MAFLARMMLFLEIMSLVMLLWIVVQLFTKFSNESIVRSWYPKATTLYIDKQNHSIRNVSFSNKRKKEDGKRNKILFFRKPQFWLDDWIGKKWDTSQVFRNCPVRNCVVTKQRAYMNKADAVLFRALEGRLKGCVKKKKRGQVWILFDNEPPTRFGRYGDLNKRCRQNVFNWTITYRRDSDFTLVHGQFSKASSPYNESAIDLILKAKTKTAVGFISRCPVPSRRKDYITKLRQYGIDVDIYGKCGNLHCDSGLNRLNELRMAWNLTPVVGMKKNCFDVLDSQYKFYLSFENSLCDDYVTEKSLNLALRHNIVPIIRDASNHTLYHPQKSYLDTKDYENIKLLAEHIRKLSSNLNEYKQYLKWKKHFSPETMDGVVQSVLCDICKRLNNQNKYKRLYRNMVENLFSRGVKSPICHDPADI